MLYNTSQTSRCWPESSASGKVTMCRVGRGAWGFRQHPAPCSLAKSAFLTKRCPQAVHSLPDTGLNTLAPRDIRHVESTDFMKTALFSLVTRINL